MSYYDPDLGRNVLVQDAEQVQQSTKKARETRERKEQTDYDTAQKEYEKDVKSAEAQYQKDLAEYNRQQAEIERLAKQQNKYDAEIARLEAQKQKELSDAHYSVWGPDGSRNRSELASMQRTIEKNYDSKINKAVEQKRIQTGYQEFSALYPGQVLPSNVAKTFRESPSFSLTSLYEQKVQGKEAQAQRRREGSIQTAQNIARRESIEYHSNIPNLGFISSYGLQEGSQRAGAIKSTPETFSSLLGGGKKAVQTRQRMTNVDTGQSIMGGQSYSPEITVTRTETYRETPDGPVLVRNVQRTIPERKASKGVPSNANPVAFVASLDRQNVDAAGIPIKPKVEKSNIEILKETLSRYQALTGEQRAPYKTVLEASLTDEGRRIDPISKLFIEQSALKQYSTRAEAFGLTEAKGRKGIIKQDGKQIFDLETGLGDVTLGRKMGFIYDYNLQRPTEEKPVLFEGSLQYVVSPKVQGPQQPKLEEAKVFPGTIDLNLRQQLKPSELGAEIQRGFQVLEQESELLAKTPKSENPLLAAYQYIYPVGSAAGKSLSAMLAFGVNQAEQVQVPFYSKLVGLKQPKMTAPIQVGDGSGVTVLPVNFEKLNILKPETYAPSFQNPLEKEYQEKQKAYIKKYGGLEYGAGIVFDYGFIAPALIKTGVKTVPKLFSRIKVPQRQLVTIKGGVSTPAKAWDTTEKIGFRKGVKPPKSTVPQIGKVTTKEPVPNPFGKERVIPYSLQQAQKRITGGLETAKTKAVQVGSKVKTAIKKDIAFPNRSLVEGRNVEIPNITRPVKPEFSKTLESLRIGLEVKRLAISKRLTEMENIYRGGISQPTSPYNRRLESLGIGLRVKRKEFVKGISNIGAKIPELKTPKGIIKFKKQVSFLTKRTVKGIEARRQNIIKSLGKLKPTIKAPYLPQKTSLEIAKFKQKEKLDATLARMRKIAISEEKPKAIVPNLSKNFLSRLKRDGVSEPWDFRSIVKPFQRLNIRKEFQSTIRGPPIGKIKGETSRKEFGDLLKDDIELPKTKLGKFPFKSKKDLLFTGSYDIKTQSFLSDIQKISRKGSDFVERQNKFFNFKKLSYNSSDIGGELLRRDIGSIIKKPTGISRIKSDTQSLVRRGKLRVSAEIKSGKIKNIFVDLNAPKIKSFVGLGEIKFRTDIKNILFKSERFTQLQKQERFSAPFTRAGFGVKEKSVKELIGEGVSKGQRITKIKNINDLKAPAQTIKPIFPVPRKPTELENILEGFKKEKPKGQIYKKVTIDKYVPKYPKEWEKWRGVGIVTAAGTISALGLGSEKAEALPFAQIGKVVGRTVESGGQILIYPEAKSGGKAFGSLGKTQKIPSLLVPPTLKETQKEDEEERTLFARPKSAQVQTILPKVSFEFSTPQRVEESFKMRTIQPAKIAVAQKPKQATRQRPKQKAVSIQTPKYDVVSIQRVSPRLAQAPKLSSPLAPKAPTRLRAPQRQPLREKPVQLLRTRPPRKPPRVIFALPPDKDPEKKKSKKESKDTIGFYLGNVPESQISGIFKRKEITLGKKKIERTRRGDVRVLLGKSRTQKRSKKQEDMFGFKKGKTTKFF